MLIVASVGSGEALPEGLSVLTSRRACQVLAVHELSAEANHDLTREMLGPIPAGPLEHHGRRPTRIAERELFDLGDLAVSSHQRPRFGAGH